MTSPFNRFFQKATNGRDPYPYQERFATADGWATPAPCPDRGR